MPRVLREGEECPSDWLRPRTKAGIDELKKRNDRIRKVIELIDDEFTKDVVKKVVEENLVELPWWDRVSSRAAPNDKKTELQ